MTYSSLQVFKLVIEGYFGLDMRQLSLWLKIIYSILIELGIVVVNLSLESVIILHLIFRIHNEWCCMMFMLPWNLRMTLFSHFHVFYFLNVYICIYILLFHFTLILLFFHFWIEVVRVETLVVWEIYLKLVRLPCLRNGLLHNQVKLFIIFSDLAEYNRLAHDLVNLIEWIVALVIHFILHNVAVAIIIRHLHFIFFRWIFFVFIHFPLEIRSPYVCCYFRCVPVNFLCLLHFYYFFISVFYVYLCQLVVSNCRLVLWEYILLAILK